MELHEPTDDLQGVPVALVGRPAAVTPREWAGVLLGRGAVLVGPQQARLIVVGEADLPLDFGREPQEAAGLFCEELQRRARCGQVEVILETELWRRLGLVEQQQAVRRLFTAAALAALLRVPVGVVRRWVRAGLLEPVKVVRHLAFFDLRQLQAARQLARWMHQGVSPQRIEQQLRALQGLLPQWTGPLDQLRVLVRGGELLLRQGEGLIDSQGQRHFDFAPAPPAHPPTFQAPTQPHVLPFPGAAENEARQQERISPEDLLHRAEAFEDQGQWEQALACYRRLLQARGPEPQLCFRLAELLYMLGRHEAAAERYWIALELDPEHLEARLNLGCLLVELGQGDEAEAQLRCALQLDDQVPDAHYHLARLLDEQGRRAEAQKHWERFLHLAPHSPWAAEARGRLRAGQEEARAGHR